MNWWAWAGRVVGATVIRHCVQRALRRSTARGRL